MRGASAFHGNKRGAVLGDRSVGESPFLEKPQRTAKKKEINPIKLVSSADFPHSLFCLPHNEG
jgi:hypothetical protein